MNPAFDRARINPFPPGDPDRHSIWQSLIERDVTAFLASDWSITAGDFLEDGFVGHAGTANPDHWRIDFPSLDAYREDWLQQAADFQKLQLKNVDKADFLFAAQTLRDIEIHGDHALAHKKFDARVKTMSGEEIVLNWQSLYRLRRVDGHWKISGFLGYLPNPMGTAAAVPEQSRARIVRPIAASQHKTAGPYSPVLRVSSQEMVVISGQGPIDDDGNIVGITIEEQTLVTLENCLRQLHAGGVTPADIFKVTVYLNDMNEWPRFNEVYKGFFCDPFPVRTTIQAVLWGGIKVEIEMTAVAR